MDAESKPITPGLGGPYGRSWLLRLRAEADRAANADSPRQWALVRIEAQSARR